MRAQPRGAISLRGLALHPAALDADDEADCECDGEPADEFEGIQGNVSKPWPARAVPPGTEGRRWTEPECRTILARLGSQGRPIRAGNQLDSCLGLRYHHKKRTSKPTEGMSGNRYVW